MISLASLLKLSLAYNIHLSDLYGEASSSNHKLVRISGRQVFEQNLKEVRIEQLTHGPALIEAQRFVLEPGANSEGSYSHDGEELIYVLDGCIDFYLDESDHHDLEVGDCLYFPSVRLHRWENNGTTRTSLLLVDTSVPDDSGKKGKYLSASDTPVQSKGRRIERR